MCKFVMQAAVRMPLDKLNRGLGTFCIIISKFSRGKIVFPLTKLHFIGASVDITIEQKKNK